MDRNLQSYIDEMGGKHGVLEFFRDRHPRMARYLVPQEILKPGQNYTEKIAERVRAACMAMNTDTVIVRTSEQSDFAGMVDVMPTTPECEFGAVNSAIDNVRRICASTGILRFSERENNGYDPGRVTVSISPFVHGKSALVTEHPNQPGVQLVDVMNEYYGVPADFRNGLRVGVPHAGDLTDYRTAMRASDAARKTGDLPNDLALQYEIVIDERGRPFLVQVRAFSPVKVADFEIEEPQLLQRQFGITPPDGIELPLVVGERRNVFEVFEREHPATPYILAPSATKDRLKLSDQPAYMRGYMPEYKPTLSHQATRPIQMCLRKPGGFAILEHSLSDKIKSGQKVKVTCNGRCFKVEF